MDYFRLPAGTMVLSSLKVGGEGLWNSFKVALVLITIWGSVGFLFFESEIDNNNPCTTMLQCWYLGVDAGFRGDMAAMHGDDHDNVFEQFTPYIDENQKQQVQWWYVMLFLFLWDFIISGIIQGQIVDAFAEIRQRAADLEEDIENNCLVCSLDRFTLEQSLGSFQDHVDDSHNPWSYLFYLVYLDELRDDLENGMCAYITQQTEQHSSEFLPVRKCYDIQQLERTAHPANEVTLDRLMEKMIELDTSVNARLDMQESMLKDLERSVVKGGVHHM